MSYKSITTLLHDSAASTDALEFAIQAARVWDAHLHVVCAGIDSTDPSFYYAGAQAIAVQQNLEYAQDMAAELDERTRARLSSEDIMWDSEAVTMMTNGLEPFLADHMRFFDLAILPLPYGDDRNMIDVAAFESCLFGADIPVLVVPDAAKLTDAPSRVLIAWDDGAEALAAARAALPLAANATTAEIYVIDPPQHGSDRSDPGGRLAQVLTRAGAQVEITVAAKMRSSIADQLLQHGLEAGAEVIVMGAYGHSRLREAVLGGVTRTMLRQSSLPVLMAR